MPVNLRTPIGGRFSLQRAAALLSITVIGASAAVAQDDHPLSYYPVITKADLQVCRSQLAASQAEQVSRERTDNKRFAVEDPKGIAEANRKLDVEARKDPMSYWADYDTQPITRLQHLNQFPENNFQVFRKQINGLGEDGRPQSEDRYLSPIYWAAENCVARMWIDKLEKRHPGALAAATREDQQRLERMRARLPMAGGMRIGGVAFGAAPKAPAASAAIPEVGKSAPAPGVPGVGSAIADQRRAPGGVSVSGPDQTGVSSVKSPRINEGPLPKTTGATGLRSNDVAPQRVLGVPADQCVMLVPVIINGKKTTMVQIRNICSFTILIPERSNRLGPGVTSSQMIANKKYKAFRD